MVTFTVYGEPASKANSRKLVMFGKRMASVKSDKALSYAEDFLRQIPATAKLNLEMDLRISLHIWYASNRPDLDPSLIYDLMQAKFEGKKGARICVRRGVYVNDRQLKEQHIYHRLDRKNPRALISIAPLDRGIA